MANINLKNISKSYDGKTMTIKDVSFDIHDQEFMVLVGPSGCGKSTILRMIAGLEEISGGDIFIGDTRINDLKPKDRDIAMVFQNYALYPHMTVYQNMAFGLKLKKFPRREIDERVQKAAEILEIEDLLQRRPSAMSGGQRQRVAIGRAIVRDPKVFLFDEPLSNLDAKLRVQMRVELQRLHQKLKSTMVYVTHDQTEAMTLGNRIVVLNKGEIMQIGTPMELYNSPLNKFVAGFIGSPQINLLEGRLTSGDGIKFVHEQSGLEVDLSDEAVKDMSAKDNPQIILGIRPENIKSSAGKEESRFCKISLPVTAVEKMGNEILVYVQAGECQLIARFDADASVEVNTKADLYFDTARIIFFDAHTEQVIN